MAHDPGPYMGPSEAELRAGYQQLMNGHDVPPRRLQRRWNVPPRVRVRLEWERSGEEINETIATSWAWVGGVLLVLVEMSDRRFPVGGVWLARGDVDPIESPQQ